MHAVSIGEGSALSPIPTRLVLSDDLLEPLPLFGAEGQVPYIVEALDDEVILRVADNLELRCRAHNAFEAERWFGVREEDLAREARAAFD